MQILNRVLLDPAIEDIHHTDSFLPVKNKGRLSKLTAEAHHNIRLFPHLINGTLLLNHNRARYSGGFG